MSIRWLFAALLAGLGLTQSALPAPPPIADFFKAPAVQAPKLSPSGRHLAILTAGEDGRTHLAVIDLATMEPGKVIAGFSAVDIVGHHWVNEDRLVFQARSPQDGTREIIAPGLWAVDRDGGGFRQLIFSDFGTKSTTSSLIHDRRLEGNWVLHSTVASEGDDVLVMRHRWISEPNSMGVQVARLNTRTGQVRNLNEGLPPDVVDWVIDGRGDPRSVTSQLNGVGKIFLRQSDGRWKLWQEFKSVNGPQLRPLWFGAKGELLALQTYQGYEALFQVNAETLTAEREPILNLKGYDVGGQLIIDAPSQRLLGVRYETDAPGSAWFDPTMKAMQANIDSQLPATINTIECQRCLDAKYIVVTAFSDRQPPLYFLYKPADKTLQRIAALRPEIRAAEMGRRDVYRIPTRDKLELPVLVTHPPGTSPGPRPAVVLVHGGPNVRGTHWPWEAQAQFLASRGYVVLEPEFRGSTGYGWAHFRAGWGQWGLAMQDDLADALAWAVQQGWVDPKRVCIAGASYGGYAALMGAVKQGALFRCAVAWSGVSDLGLLSSISWSDASDEWKNHGMKDLIGDAVTDAERFKATSPLHRSREITMPLLLAHGGDDRRVPIKHSEDFKSALRDDQDVEWVVYSDEGHGWFKLKTHEDFWGRVERFLARNIGAASR